MAATNSYDVCANLPGSALCGYSIRATRLREMFDPFFRWLESTAVSVWINESPSLFAFPGILAAHTIGLGLLAGLNSALDLRLLGVARSIPPGALTRLL